MDANIQKKVYGRGLVSVFQLSLFYGRSVYGLKAEVRFQKRN